MPYHHLLERQLRDASHFEKKGQDLAALLRSDHFDVETFLEQINQVYLEHDTAQETNDRAMRLMSEELMDLNKKIRQEAALELAESERKFHAIVDNVPGVIFSYRFNNLHERGAAIVFMAPSIKELVGYSHDYFVNQDVERYREILHPEDRERKIQTVMASTVGGDAYTVEYRMIHKDGSIRWVHESGQAQLDSRGVAKWVEGVIIDITPNARNTGSTYRRT